MTKASNETKLRLARFKDLYNSALASSESDRERMRKNMDQYLGSDVIDGSTERATVVRNITYEIVESEINADIPVPKVDTSCYSLTREQNARAVERLTSALRSRLPFEELNDRDERYTYVYGGSVFYIEWDSSQTDNAGEGGVRLHLLSPMDFIPQPSIDAVEDMEYCFLHFTTTASELVTKYGIKEEDLRLADCEYLADLDDPMGDAVAVIVCFYRDEGGNVGKFVFSGDLPLLDMPNYYKRKFKVCRSCGKGTEECRCDKPSYGYIDLDNEQVSLEDGKRIGLPYYVPGEFPIVIRKNTLGDTALLGGSDCERIRSQQQAINKVESRILQKLLRSGVTPIMPEGTAITLSNAVFGQIIKTRPGESINSYGKIDTTPDISQDIEEADRLYDQAKRVLGISDALQGLDATTSESGYARQLKIARASSRLETKKRMKHLAYCRIYELIFKHYLAFADEPRRFAYRDTMGRMHFTEFNRFDFIESDKDGNYYYDDSYLFTVDTNADAQYQSEVLWEINLTNLERGTLGDKENPNTLMRYWQLQDKAHFPYARENVEYFQDLINRQSESDSPNTQPQDKKGKNNEKEGKKRIC
ncbi:MAG: hypothetical protein J6V80_00760 [Clostridia bacterium]|nr:hypothetical protein [Clostridia bacterium]